MAASTVFILQSPVLLLAHFFLPQLSLCTPHACFLAWEVLVTRPLARPSFLSCLVFSSQQPPLAHVNNFSPARLLPLPCTCTRRTSSPPATTSPTCSPPLLFHAVSSFIFGFPADKPRNARKRRTNSSLARPLGISPFSSSLPLVLTPLCTRPAPHANYSHARDLTCKLHVNLELSLFIQLLRQLELHANKDRVFSKDTKAARRFDKKKKGISTLQEL